MSALQHFDSRRWKRDEIMYAVAIFHGEMSPAGVPYKAQWYVRTLIASQRYDRSTSPFGSTYGPDWKGWKKSPDGTTVFDGGLKADIRDYLKRGVLPYHVMQTGTKYIRERELYEWAIYKSRRHLRRIKRARGSMKGYASDAWFVENHR